MIQVLENSIGNPTRAGEYRKRDKNMKKSDFVDLEEMELVNRNFLEKEKIDVFSNPKENELDITESRLQTMLLIQMGRNIKTIKSYMLFFVILTVISLVFSVVAILL